MFDIFRTKKIGKLSKTHYEDISQKDIVYNITSVRDAKKFLSQEEFEIFTDLIQDLCQDDEPVSINITGYQQISFTIANEINEAVPYSKVCGDASDIDYIFSQKKPVFDNLVNLIGNEFLTTIGKVMEFEGGSLPNTLKMWGSAQGFLIASSKAMMQSEDTLVENYFIDYAFKVANREISDIIANFYNISDVFDSDEYKDGLHTTLSLCKKIYREDPTYIKFIKAAADTFLNINNANGDVMSAPTLMAMIDGWKDKFK